jgi:hypothetical protein
MSDPQQLRDAIMEALDDNDAFSAGKDEVATVLEAIDTAGWLLVPKLPLTALTGEWGWRYEQMTCVDYCGRPGKCFELGLPRCGLSEKREQLAAIVAAATEMQP